MEMNRAHLQCQAIPQRANEHDYIYMVKSSPPSSLTVGVCAVVAQERLCQSNLAAVLRDFDVLKGVLTCVYIFINQGWKVAEKTDQCWEGLDKCFLQKSKPHCCICFILCENKEGEKMIFTSKKILIHRGRFISNTSVHGQKDLFS